MAFFQQRDYDLWQSINREFINDFVEIPVIIYKLDMQTTEENLYGESVGGKTYQVGFKVNALISRDDQTANNEGFGTDRQQTMQFRFLRETLEKVSFKPNEGDIISFFDAFYEINLVIENQLVAGNPKFNHSIICDTQMTRRSRLNIEELR